MQNQNGSAVSPLRLRVGVVLIIVWWVPFWLLAPYIAQYVDSADSEHLTAAITTIIVVIQTIIGIIGFIVAGSAVKVIIKGSTKKQALGKIWYMLIHGKLA